MYDENEMTFLVDKLYLWIQNDIKKNNVGYKCAQARLLAAIKEKLELKN